MTILYNFDATVINALLDRCDLDINQLARYTVGKESGVKKRCGKDIDVLRQSTGEKDALQLAEVKGHLVIVEMLRPL